MSDLVFGLLAIVVGLFLCLRGQWALRILIAIWGAFVGFTLGAGLVNAFSGEGFLTSALGWVVGLVVAVVFSALAYLYYAVGIVLAMAAMGFVLGGTIASALGVTGDWIPVLLGALCGVALALLAIVAELPQFILIVISALTGATVLISGIMIVSGVVGDAEGIAAGVRVADYPWWYVAYLAAAVVGIIVQLRLASSLRAPVRDTWAASEA